MKLTLSQLMLTILALISAACAVAQPYPNKPIRFVIGFPPGTSLDPAARLVGNEMTKRLGQPIVLEYKPGANGTIGAKYVVNANPDGYTILYGGAATIHPLLNRNNSVDASKELVPISEITTGPWALLSRANLPGSSFQELAGYAKANPAVLKYGSPVPTVGLSMAVLKARTGLSAESIPYKASSQVIVAMLAGEIDLTIGSPGPYLQHIQSGKVRALFVASANRSSVLPNVPTAAELGIPNFEVGLNVGLWAPLGTPQEVVQKLNTAAIAALKAPGVADEIRTLGVEPTVSTPEAQKRKFEAEMNFWSEALRLANYRPE